MIRTLILKKHHAWHIRFTLAVLLFGTSFAAFSASPPIPLTWQNLKDNTSLGSQITLEAKHLPLADLLTQASRQSGINLSLSPNSSLSGKLVTARISKMNLYDFMGAIGRTYNASWSKAADGSFTLTPKDEDTLEEGISQMGAPLFFRYRDRWLPPEAQKAPGENDIKIRNALYQKVLLLGDQKALKSDKGIPLSSLPPTLADALEHQFKKANAVNFLLKYSAYKVISENDIIRIIIKQDPNPVDIDAWLSSNMGSPLFEKIVTIELLTPDKKLIMYCQ